MKTEPVVIDTFVSKLLETSKVQNYTSKWRIEHNVLEKLICDHFREMGIFAVAPDQHKTILDHMIQYIQNSPELAALVRKTERKENARRRARANDV